MDSQEAFESSVVNPGSALGEAIGALLEAEIHRILKPIAEAKGCIYITSGPEHPATSKRTKLILMDSDGNEYNIDSVIINRRFQPLVLIESKYIRYKKHNRDKASWICTAHTKLRQKFPTIRKSITVLMGSWSKPSKRLLQSFEVDLFEISFEDVCRVLAKYSIGYAWKEKDREAATASWQRFCQLDENQRQAIANELIATIENDLRQFLETALDESVPRKVRSVTVVVRSNHGETYTYNFPDLQQAVQFMQSFDEMRDMDTSNAPILLLESPKGAKQRHKKQD